MGAETLTKDEVHAALVDSEGLMSLAANRLGVTRQTVYNYLERYPELQEVRSEARHRLVDIAEKSLLQAVESQQGWAVCFTLKTIGKDRGYVERVEQSGLNGEPIEVVVKHVERAA